MLTSVLHTDKAIDAGIQIMEAFVEMSHFLRQNSVLLPQQEIQLLSLRQDKLQAEIKDIKERMVAKSDLSDLIKLFDAGKRITVITELKAVDVYQDTIKRLLDNLPLVLS